MLDVVSEHKTKSAEFSFIDFREPTFSMTPLLRHQETDNTNNGENQVMKKIKKDYSFTKHLIDCIHRTPNLKGKLADIEV